MERETEIIIVGAGMAGLTAAKILKSYNRKVLVLEAESEVGGHLRTDKMDGFLLDRGFQVLFTAFPEAMRYLDYELLDLRPFTSGAYVCKENRISYFSDPIRNPSEFLKGVFAPIGSLTDKMKLLKLRFDLSACSIDDIFSRPETTTDVYLKNKGFSEQIISNFFRPFFSAIFFEPKLQTSSRMFEFVFKMMNEGDTVVPSGGMGMIPKQLASFLKPDELLLNEKVMNINGNEVFTYSGKRFKAKAILLATDADCVPMPFKGVKNLYRKATTIYFSAAHAPIRQGTITLNASNSKLVNNVAVMDQVSSSYAPTGRSLISVSLTGDFEHINQKELVKRVIDELKRWYPGAPQWLYLKTYHIPHPLPENTKVCNELSRDSLKIGPNQYICGDYLLNSSLNGAMRSGRLAAELIMSEVA